MTEKMFMVGILSMYIHVFYYFMLFIIFTVENRTYYDLRWWNSLVCKLNYSVVTFL